MTTINPPTKRSNSGGISMRNPRNSRDGERGQILVIVAGGAITLILLMGLVLDAGVAFFNRRDGQNASDLMALAGTKFVADTHRSEPQADPTITSTHVALTRAALANDCAATGDVPCTWQAWFVGAGPVDLSVVGVGSTVPSNALGVRVEVLRRPQTFVIGFAGISNWNVSTQAMATAQKITKAPAGQLLPIAFKQPLEADGVTPSEYQPGQVYDLTDGKDLPGGFGYISWTGSNSAGALETSLCTPNNPEFSLPRNFPGDPGKTNSSGVRACLDEWIDSGRTVLIPIYDTTTGNGNGAQYHIIGVAAFVLTAREQPAVDNIRGYFVEIFMSNPVPGGVGALPPGPGDTSYSVALIQ
jgi:hypothetical protein